MAPTTFSASFFVISAFSATLLTNSVLYKIYRGAKPLLRKPGSKVKSLLKKIAKAFRRFKK
jgi:hypothetical protein